MSVRDIVVAYVFPVAALVVLCGGTLAVLALAGRRRRSPDPAARAAVDRSRNYKSES